ncbi:hypothetical protein L7F22_062798 [Adiantum nelumboides]|nr:hypothetical protein [Adiantum nelumboides]
MAMRIQRRASVEEGRGWQMGKHAVMLLLALALLSGPRRLAEAATMYCVANANADTSKLQEALDWTCGRGSNMGSVDCSAIQSGGSCFQPDTLANHASYAFTLYYYHQKAASEACDFKGLATLSSINPSSGSCVYPTSEASASTSPSSGSSPSNSGSITPLPLLGSPAPSPNGAPPPFSPFPSCVPLLFCALLLALLLR